VVASRSTGNHPLTSPTPKFSTRFGLNTFWAGWRGTSPTPNVSTHFGLNRPIIHGSAHHELPSGKGVSRAAWVQELKRIHRCQAAKQASRQSAGQAANTLLPPNSRALDAFAGMYDRMIYGSIHPRRLGMVLETWKLSGDTITTNVTAQDQEICQARENF
jgi:hypothetical protein